MLKKKPLKTNKKNNNEKNSLSPKEIEKSDICSSVITAV